MAKNRLITVNSPNANLKALVVDNNTCGSYDMIMGIDCILPSSFVDTDDIATKENSFDS